MSSHSQASDAPTYQQTRVIVGGAASGGRVALVETRLRRGQELPRHRHHWEDELVVVVAGRLAVWIDGDWAEVVAGGTVFLPRGSEHALLAVSDEVRLLITFAPAGFEDVYQELAKIDGDADLGRLVAVAARYGVEVTGPPPDQPQTPPDGPTEVDAYHSARGDR
jgi:quercetin dioxygenase-like cupin family protein